LFKLKNFFGILENSFSIPDRVTVHGAIDASTSGRIVGIVNGDVRSTGKLIINVNGRVNGDVYAEEVLLFGKVYGNVYCKHKIVLHNLSFVQGNVRAMTIETEEGAIIDGMVENNSSLVEQPQVPDTKPEPLSPATPAIEPPTVVPEPEQVKEEGEPQHWF
jgi:cytoskeletal protein CcmA (bactofilin family)